LALFAHGSGSSRHSPRNQFVARVLQEAGTGTLLFDLLTREEEAIDARTGELRFDIGLLAQRLVAATRWVARQSRNWHRSPLSQTPPRMFTCRFSQVTDGLSREIHRCPCGQLIVAIRFARWRVAR
jgi:hypothetical protein